MKRLLLVLLTVGWYGIAASLSVPVMAQPAKEVPKEALKEPAKEKQDWSKKGRGYKLPPPHVRAAQHAAAFRRHGHRMARHVAAMTAPATFDSRTLGWIPPIRDQGNCGDCYWVSAADSTTCAFIKAGQQKADGSFVLSEQYGLDCGVADGGCNGGDGPQCMAVVKAKGMPAEKYIDSSGKPVLDYRPYTATPGRCQLTPTMKLWQPADWLFVTSDQSDRAPTLDEVKAGVMNYGNVCFAFDASNLDTVVTRLGNNIDHEITGVIGWDDSKKQLICRNQWGASFGDGGYFYLAYSCLPQIVEAYSVVATQLPPPPPPPGPGPGPQPAGAPVITSPLTAAGAIGAAFKYQITATNAPTDFGAAGGPQGVECAGATGLISGTPTSAGTFNITISAANASGTTTATLVLTITAPTPPPTPVGPTLTISQPLTAGTYQVVAVGSLVITKEEASTITAVELLSRLEKCKAGTLSPSPACCGNAAAPKDDLAEIKAMVVDQGKKINELMRGYAAIIAKVLPPEQPK